MAKFVLTAGHTHSLPTVLIGEGIIRAGHEVASVMVVSPWQLSRAYRLVRQRGAGWLCRRVGLMRRRASMPPSRLDTLASEMGVRSGRIRSWAWRHGVPVKDVKSLNDSEAVTYLEQLIPDAVVYGGGGILRAPFIQAAGTVLNAHAGPLPDVRGMNAAEWAYLLGARREITIHRIDEGIDTGAPISVRALAEKPMDVDDLRELAVMAGVEEMIEVIREDRWRETSPVTNPQQSRQCFVMASAIREVLNWRIQAEP